MSHIFLLVVIKAYDVSKNAHVELEHVILHILIQSSSWVLNQILPACRQNL